MGVKINKAPPLGKTLKPVVASELVENKSKGVNIQKSSAAAQVLGTPPMANVGVEAVRTVNLGDYNSLRVGVSLHVPCGNTIEEIEAAYEYATQWVDGRMAELLGEHGQ